MRIFPLSQFFRRLWDMVFFERKLEAAVPIVVCQMGKVGSASLYDSLRQQYPGVVLHAHTFKPDDKYYRIQCLYRWAVKQNRPLLIISPIREPIGQAVSSFFQNFQRDNGVVCTLEKFPVEELRRRFLGFPRHDRPLNFFDEQIKPSVGIDVYATPFPESGIAQYTQGRTRLLVMRAELDDREKAQAVADFVGLPNFVLTNTNISSEKQYGEASRVFKKEVRLPAEYVEKMCSSKYFKHFYSPATIEKIRQKWLAA